MKQMKLFEQITDTYEPDTFMNPPFNDPYESPVEYEYYQMLYDHDYYKEWLVKVGKIAAKALREEL